MTQYVNLIQRHKRTAATVALLGTSLMFAGCGDEPKAPVEFKLGRLEQVTNRAGDVSAMLFNNDRSMAYVKNAGGTLFRINTKDGVKAFSNNDNWKALSLKNDAAAGTVGLAKLNEREPDPTSREIFLAKDGLLVLAQLKTAAAADLPALAYFKGEADVPTNAWTSDAAHVAGTPAVLRANSLWMGAVAVTMNDGKERFVVVNDAKEVSSVEVGPNQFTGKNGKATAFTTIPKMAFDKKSESVLFVSESGVAFLETSKLGADNPIPDEGTDAKAVKWERVAGTANRTVQEIVAHDGILYVNLSRTLPTTGGISAYNIAEKKITAPVAKWDASARDLHVDGDNVRAIVNDNLINLNKTDAAPGDTVLAPSEIASNKFSRKNLLLGDDLKKTQYLFTILPRTIDSVYMVGDNFLLKDTGAKLYTLIYENASIPGEKVKTASENKE